MMKNHIERLQWQQTWQKNQLDCEVCCFDIIFLFTFLALLFLLMKIFRYTGHVKTSWISWIFSASGPPTDNLWNILTQIWICQEAYSQPIDIFSLFCISSPPWPYTGDLYHLDSFIFYCRWLKQKQIRTILVNPWKMMISKKLKLIKKTQVYACNICGKLFHVWRRSIWPCFKYSHNCTICNI